MNEEHPKIPVMQDIEIVTFTAAANYSDTPKTESETIVAHGYDILSSDSKHVAVQFYVVEPIIGDTEHLSKRLTAVRCGVISITATPQAEAPSDSVN